MWALATQYLSQAMSNLALQETGSVRAELVEQALAYSTQIAIKAQAVRSGISDTWPVKTVHGRIIGEQGYDIGTKALMLAESERLAWVAAEYAVDAEDAA